MPDYNLVKEALTNLSVRYKSPGMIGEIALPRVPVTKTSAKYYVYDKENLRRDQLVRAGKTASVETTYTVSTGTYTMVRHAVHGLVDWEDRENAAGTAISPDADMTEHVTDKMLQSIEYDCERLIFDTADYASGHKAAITGTARWDISTISDPIAAVESGSLAILKKTGVRPNTLVLGAEVWKGLKTNDAVQDVIKYTGFGLPSEQLIAQMFDVKRVLRAEGIYNSVAEGQTDSLLYLWGKRAALIYVPERPALRTPSFGYIFSRPEGRTVKSWYNNERDATFIEVEDQYEVKKVDGECGFIFDNVVS